MITDTTINAWGRWLAYSISGNPASPLFGIPIQLRDSEDLKTYPGIYLEESGRPNRIEVGGVMDGNAWQVSIATKLVTTPGEDDQGAESKAAHDALRNALSHHVNSEAAQSWIGSQLRITCFQILYDAPETTEEDGYRVTTWVNELTVCVG